VGKLSERRAQFACFFEFGDIAFLFALKAALDTYHFIQTKIQECDCCIQQHLAQFESRAAAINSPQDLKAQLHCGELRT
jgi:hypothetical protein